MIREPLGKVLKERRSPCERGRMGTSAKNERKNRRRRTSPGGAPLPPSDPPTLGPSDHPSRRRRRRRASVRPSVVTTPRAESTGRDASPLTTRCPDKTSAATSRPRRTGDGPSTRSTRARLCSARTRRRRRARETNYANTASLPRRRIVRGSTSPAPRARI
eukprot:22483-Pelagococcus_subviridis.AAC.3